MRSHKSLRISRIASDIVGGTLEGFSVLDLGCRDAACAIEFARRGANVTAIEGRESNIQIALTNIAKSGFRNVKVVKDDVRKIKAYGEFDIVLCLGILHRLDSPDNFVLIKDIAKACGRFTIVETQISIEPRESRHYDGVEYWGRTYAEHRSRSTMEERLRASWASLDNVNSFWLTEASLYNLLQNSGFTSIGRFPFAHQMTDRRIIVAFKGLEPLNPNMDEQWSEDEITRVHPHQRRMYGPIWNRLRLAKRLLENYA